MISQLQLPCTPAAVWLKTFMYIFLHLYTNKAPPLQWVFICREPTTEHLHEICSLLRGGGFVNIRWRKRPGLGIIQGIVTIFSTAIFFCFSKLNCLPSEGEKGSGERNDCVGVWCPPSFSVTVASPLYLILPGHQLLLEWHLLKRKTLPLWTTPSYPRSPPGLLSVRCPRGQAVADEAKFTLWEWLQWQWCFFWLSAGTSSYLACCTRSPQIGLWQADSQTGWLPCWLSGPITRSL